MNLNQLRIFYESAKELNFSRAADHLNISQPAVSSQIRQFEEALKIKLFIKVHNRVHLSEPGRLLFEYARKIFDLEHDAEAALTEVKDLRRGTLHVGTTKTYARYLMPHYISLFHARHPDVMVYLNEGSSMEMIQSLLDQKSELAIVATTHYQGVLNKVTFAHEEVLLVASPNHPLAGMGKVTVEELSRIPLILREEGSGTRRVVTEMFKERNLCPTVLYEASNLDFIKEVLIEGEGASFMVRAAVEKELALGLLKEISIPQTRLTIDASIVYLDEKNLSRAANAFLAILANRSLTVREENDAKVRRKTPPILNERASGGPL